MTVSDFMKQHGIRRKGVPRHRVTYRAARRNIAKIAYRKAKRS